MNSSWDIVFFHKHMRFSLCTKHIATSLQILIFVPKVPFLDPKIIFLHRKWYLLPKISTWTKYWPPNKRNQNFQFNFIWMGKIQTEWTSCLYLQKEPLLFAWSGDLWRSRARIWSKPGWGRWTRRSCPTPPSPLKLVINLATGHKMSALAKEGICLGKKFKLTLIAYERIF